MAGKPNKNTIPLIVGISLIVTILLLLFLFPNTNDKQFLILRILISLGASGVAATIPGFFNFKYKGLVSAGGALGVFAFVYVLNPATITTEAFSITVYPVMDNGLNTIPDAKGTQIIIDLGNDRRTENLDSRGLARFSGIPPSFVGKYVRVTISGDIYKPAKDSLYKIFNNASIYLLVDNKDLDVVNGIVLDEKLSLLQGAIAAIDDSTAITDYLGRFKIKIKKADQARIKKLIVTKPGYKTWIEDVTPESKQIVEVKLTH